MHLLQLILAVMPTMIIGYYSLINRCNRKSWNCQLVACKIVSNLCMDIIFKLQFLFLSRIWMNNLQDLHCILNFHKQLCNQLTVAMKIIKAFHMRFCLNLPKLQLLQMPREKDIFLGLLQVLQLLSLSNQHQLQRHLPIFHHQQQHFSLKLSSSSIVQWTIEWSKQ